MIGMDTKFLQHKKILEKISQAFCKHLQGLPCNAHSLSEAIIPAGASLESSTVNYVGNALYPALSMINHSCSPNVVRISYGQGQCVLKALFPIKSGEQIFDNYSLHFATSPLHERRDNLKRQYHFDCGCRPCVENWPMFEDLLQLPAKLRLICCQCLNEIDLTTLVCDACNCSIRNKYNRFLFLQSRLSSNMELMLGKQFEQVENYLVEFIGLLQEIIKPPNILFNQISEMLKFIWSLEGSHVTFVPMT